jgi:hypothetical protein
MVRIMGCQDIDNDSFYCESGSPAEPAMKSCGTGSIDLTTSLVPFDPTRYTVVFVDMARRDCALEEGMPVAPGTRGTITMTFS